MLGIPIRISGLKTACFKASHVRLQGQTNTFILPPTIAGSKCVETGKKKRRRTQAATWPPRPASALLIRQ